MIITIIILLVFIVIVPSLHYFRQPKEITKRENADITKFFGKTYPIIFGIAVLITILNYETISKNDLYLTIAGIIFSLTNYKLLSKKYSGQQRKSLKLVNIYLVIFLMVQLVIFFLNQK